MCKCLCSCVIVLINIVFMLLGLVFAALGGILLFGLNTLLNLASGMLKDLLSSLTVQVDINKILEEVVKLIRVLPNTLLAIGIIFFVLSIIAYMVACCNYKILTYVYIGIVSVILIMSLITVIILYSKASLITDPLANEMKNIIKNDYEGTNSTEPKTTIINLVQFLLQCCGATNGSDFNTATKWKRNNTKQITFGNISTTISINLAYPVSCCKMKDNQPVNLTGCALGQGFVNTEGCVSKLTKEVSTLMKNPIAIGSISGILVLQALLIVASVVILVIGNSVEPI